MNVTMDSFPQDVAAAIYVTGEGIVAGTYALLFFVLMSKWYESHKHPNRIFWLLMTGIFGGMYMVLLGQVLYDDLQTKQFVSSMVLPITATISTILLASLVIVVGSGLRKWAESRKEKDSK